MAGAETTCQTRDRVRSTGQDRIYIYGEMGGRVRVVKFSGGRRLHSITMRRRRTTCQTRLVCLSSSRLPTVNRLLSFPQLGGKPQLLPYVDSIFWIFSYAMASFNQLLSFRQLGRKLNCCHMLLQCDPKYKIMLQIFLKDFLL